MSSRLKNSVQLIGHLGKDVEIMTFDSGSKKASITIATNDYYTDNKGEKVKKTEWHNLVAWGKTAELMSQTLAKGHEVAIEGRLTSRSWEGKNGKNNYITEIVVNEFYKLTRSEQQ